MMAAEAGGMQGPKPRRVGGKLLEAGKIKEMHFLIELQKEQSLASTVIFTLYSNFLYLL